MKLQSIPAYLCAIFLVTDSFSQTLKYADSLFRASSFKHAAVYYEKALYESANPSVNNQLLFKKAICYKQQLDYKAELENLHRIQIQLCSDSFRYACYYEKSLSLYLSKNYSAAAQEMLNLNFFVRDSTLRLKNLYLEILIDCQMDLYEEAAVNMILFMKMEKLSPDSAMLLKLKHPAFKNIQKARLMSAFLPGLGQAYTGQYKDATFSFLLTGGAAAYGIVSVIGQYYFSAVFTGATFCYRFYAGGLKYSQKCALNYNEQKKNALIADISDYLSLHLK